MDSDKTRRLLTALSNGTDPFTGRDLPADSPCQHPDVVRALFHALQRLDAPAAPAVPAPVVAALEAGSVAAASASPRRKAARPGKAGRPWSPEEDACLGQGFDDGDGLDTLAQRLQRSRLAVEVRLAKLGRLPLPENTRFGPSRPAGPSTVPPRAEQSRPLYRVAA